MSATTIFSEISEDFIEKYSLSDEKFNLFIAKGFVKNEKYTEAIQQLELGLNASSPIYVSYLLLIAISIEISDVKKMNKYIDTLNNGELPKEVLVKLEHLLSVAPEDKCIDIKCNSKFEILLKSLCANDNKFIGWISFNSNNDIESSISIPANFMNFILEVQSEITISNTNSTSILGNTLRLVYEFNNHKLFYTKIDGKNLFFLGDEQFSLNYILLRINE